MTELAKIVVIVAIINTINALPFDDGKYHPRKYVFDDGKYYRPLDEGKYIPGDEGKYTYIYRLGLYPGDDGDYRYIHQEGPRGPDGSPGMPGGYYLNHKIYAEKYRHMNIDDWAGELVDKYVSSYNNGNSFNGEQSENYYKRLQAVNTFVSGRDGRNCSNFWDGFGQYNKMEDGERLVSLYKVQGQKNVSVASNNTSKNLRLVYNVLINVYEDIND